MADGSMAGCAKEEVQQGRPGRCADGNYAKPAPHDSAAYAITSLGPNTDVCDLLHLWRRPKSGTTSRALRMLGDVRVGSTALNRCAIAEARLGRGRVNQGGDHR